MAGPAATSVNFPLTYTVSTGNTGIFMPTTSVLAAEPNQAGYDVACVHAGHVTRWTGTSKTKQFQQVGNACPPKLAYAIVKELV